MAKTRNHIYNRDDNEAEMDKKIKTLEKHLEIATKEKMIADLENKNKKGHCSKKS